MVSGATFLRSGHAPTLLLAFLYFDVSFMVWVVNGAMAPFISDDLRLTAAQKGLMVSVPVLAGGLLRIPLGFLAEVWGRKNAAMLGMVMTVLGLLYGWRFADSYTEVLIMGGMLGVAGASFAVALPLGSGWFPPRYQGLAMGIAGAGNSGTVLAGLVGFSSFLPTFFRDQYALDKVRAGQFMIVVALTASAVRVLGGFLSDRVGGINVLKVLYLLIAVTALLAAWLPPLPLMLVVLFFMAVGMGAGNGAVFQLLPFRWPQAKAIATGVVGEFGALGGAFIPAFMGLAKESTGSFAGGFRIYAASAVIAWLLLLWAARIWTRRWIGEGGRARTGERDLDPVR